MKEYMEKHLAPLVNQTITGLVTDGDDDEAFYGLKFGNGTVAWVLCDPEGNGPGHLDIDAVPV